MRDFKHQTTKIKSGSLTVFLELCKGCGICLVKCPKKCLSNSNQKGVYDTPAPKVEPEKCILCGICEIVCPDQAIKVEKE